MDIAADAGAGLGIFEDLHGFPSADAFARHLKMAASEHYGVASAEFLDRLTSDFDAIAPTVIRYRDRFLTENCPTGADGQVSRVAARFGLVAAGGEMASEFGILPWKAGEATRLVAKCFHDWLSERGGVEPAEEREGIAAVRRFIELHRMSRFEAMGDLAPTDFASAPSEQRVLNRVGFRRQARTGGIEYLVLKEAWRTEVCAGFDATMVAKALLGRGLLVPGSGDTLQNFQRVPGSSNPIRCYVISPDILADEGAHKRGL